MDIRTSPLESAVAEVLRLRLAVSRISQREAERLLGFKHGVVGNLLRGRTALRIQHLELFGRLLGVAPAQILTEALGLAEASDNGAMARRIASHVVDELLQRTADADTFLRTPSNS